MSFEFTAPEKDPDSILRHAHDVSKWLLEGETITGTPQVFSTPAGLVIDQIAHEAGIVSYRISGGTVGDVHMVTCRVATNQGRSDDRTVRYEIRQR